MELATPLITSKLTKKYKLFTIDSSPVKKMEHALKSEFFYLGKKHEKIDKLLEVFDGGYAAESVDNAQSILERLYKSNAILPIVFITDGNFELEKAKAFYKAVQSIEVLKNIPIIVDIENTDDIQLQLLRKFALIDDSVAINSIDEKFINRINVITKIKQEGNAKTFEKRIQTSVKSMGGSASLSKRVFDILVSGIALLLLSPLFLIIAIAIKIESRGPVFYISKRAGRGYKIFDFFKFRSMAIDADKQVDQLVHLNQYGNANTEGPVFFKMNNDPRVTKVGNFLRNTSLDELPQLLNVFKGDMSLVGNRPLPLYEAATLTTDQWAERFMAPAGITGLWQIKKRGQAEMSAEERISLDIDYANNHSFKYDLWIMANTPSALIQKSNV